MNRVMNRIENNGLAILVSIIVALGLSPSAFAQGDTTKTTAAAPIAITASTSPLDLARAALAAQGGDKFKNLKNMVLVGSVDLYAPNSTQSLPGKFVIAVAGDKIMIDIDARPLLSFKQISNGVTTYSSIPGAQIPSPGKFGINVLAKFDQPGYTVTALPDKKKQRGFKIADSEGNATDFYIDPANGRVISYSGQVNGYNFGVENKKMKEVDGVLVPYNFTQRIELPQGAAFAEYTVKDAKLNQTLGDDVFAIPN